MVFPLHSYELYLMIIEFCSIKQKWQLNNPLFPYAETCKKHKKCCKEYKKGDRCKKCPGRK